MKSIPELKRMIIKADKPYLGRLDNSAKIDIEVCGNNIIKIHNKPISWVDFQDLIYNRDYILHLGNDIMKNERGHGGMRLPGPGKKIGRPKSENRKIPTSFTLHRGTIEKINQFALDKCMSKSEVVEHLVLVCSVL